MRYVLALKFQKWKKKSVEEDNIDKCVCRGLRSFMMTIYEMQISEVMMKNRHKYNQIKLRYNSDCVTRLLCSNS